MAKGRDPKRATQAVRAFLWVHTRDDPGPPDWEADAAWLEDPPWADALVRSLVGRAPSSVQTPVDVRALIAKMVVGDGLADVFSPTVDPGLYSDLGTHTYSNEEADALRGLLSEAVARYGLLHVLQETNLLMYEVLTLV